MHQETLQARTYEGKGQKSERSLEDRQSLERRIEVNAAECKGEEQSGLPASRKEREEREVDPELWDEELDELGEEELRRKEDPYSDYEEHRKSLEEVKKEIILSGW